MTRKRLHRILSIVFALCGVLLGVAAAAKLVSDPPLAVVYDFIRDMSLIFVVVVAAYMAHVLQRRLTFLQSLREEWREIVDTKSALITFCDRENPGLDDYLATYARISKTLDYMRIVYANVGETEELIGLYPYEPLHDMRKALERLDPRTRGACSPAERAAARDAIWEAFNVLREHFLEEFELEEPARPIIQPNSRRTKRAGAELAPAQQELPHTTMTSPPPDF